MGYYGIRWASLACLLRDYPEAGGKTLANFSKKSTSFSYSKLVMNVWRRKNPELSSYKLTDSIRDRLGLLIAGILVMEDTDLKVLLSFVDPAAQRIEKAYSAAKGRGNYSQSNPRGLAETATLVSDFWPLHVEMPRWVLGKGRKSTRLYDETGVL